MIRNHVLQHQDQERASEGDIMRGVVARGIVKKSGSVRIMRGKSSEKMTKSNTSSPRESEVSLAPREDDNS